MRKKEKPENRRDNTREKAEISARKTAPLQVPIASGQAEAQEGGRSLGENSAMERSPMCDGNGEEVYGLLRKFGSESMTKYIGQKEESKQNSINKGEKQKKVSEYTIWLSCKGMYLVITV